MFPNYNNFSGLYYDGEEYTLVIITFKIMLFKSGAWEMVLGQ